MIRRERAGIGENKKTIQGVRASRDSWVAIRCTKDSPNPLTLALFGVPSNPIESKVLIDLWER